MDQLSPRDRRMYEVAFRQFNAEAIRLGHTSPTMLYDSELIAWAEKNNLTRADIVRINT